MKLLRENIKARNVVYNWHDAETSVVEGVLSRGDRRLGAVLYEVWKHGGTLEAWSDFFDYARWLNAFEVCGVDPAFYTTRERGRDELFPWDRADMGVTKRHLWREWEKCLATELSPDCRAGCVGCGARKLMGQCPDREGGEEAAANG